MTNSGYELFTVSDTTIKPGEMDTYTTSYTITQSDVDSGAVINTVSATGSSPGRTNDVSDISDDNDDGDGNTTDDPTVVTITPSATMKVVKTATVSDVNGNSVNDTGDIIYYTITVTNTGNVTLSGVTVSDLSLIHI